MTVHKTPPKRILLRAGFPLLLWTILIVGFPSFTLALTCLPRPSPFQELEKKDAVFLATVTSTEDYYEFSDYMDWIKKSVKYLEIAELKTRKQKGTLSVEKRWKGTPVNTLDYVSFGYRGWNLTQGEKYLFYISTEKEPVVISACWFPKGAKYAEVEMMLLDWSFEGLSREEIHSKTAEILVSHKDRGYRLQAAYILKRILAHQYSEEVENALLKAIKDPDPEVRSVVLWSVSNFQLPNDPKGETLFRLFKDMSIREKSQLMAGLSYFMRGKTNRKEMEKTLLKILREDYQRELISLERLDASEKYSKLEAIQKIIGWIMNYSGETEKEEFIPMIFKGIKSPESSVRKATIPNIFQMEQKSQAFVPRLKALLDEDLTQGTKDDIQATIYRLEHTIWDKE